MVGDLYSVRDSCEVGVMAELKVFFQRLEEEAACHGLFCFYRRKIYFVGYEAERCVVCIGCYRRIQGLSV